MRIQQHKSYHTHLLLTIVCLLSPSSLLGSDAKWENVLEKDGVKVYSMEIPGSDVVAFRGTKVVKQPMDRLAFVLLNNDITTKKQWIDRLGEFKILEKNSKHSVTYSSYNLPWPISDRDFVVQALYKLNHQKNQFALELNSVKHKDAPSTVGVRGELLASLYQLTAIDRNTTFVELEIHSDPKGLLPNWLVNKIQESWPYNTIMKMEQQVSKAHNKPHPMVTPLLPKKQTKGQILNSH